LITTSFRFDFLREPTSSISLENHDSKFHQSQYLIKQAVNLAAAPFVK